MQDQDSWQPLGFENWDRPDPGPVWKALLGGGKPDGAGLRRWQFWIWYTTSRSAAQQLQALFSMLLSWLATPLVALRAVSQYGGKVAGVHGVPRLRQFWQLVYLRYAAGVRPVPYYKYQMFRPERLRLAADYVEDAGKLLQVLSRRIPPTSDSGVLVNKEHFNRWASQHGVATPPVLLKGEDGRVTDRSRSSLPEVDLFVKPTNWRAGKGVSRWHFNPDARPPVWDDGRGHVVTAAELESLVAELSSEHGRPFIVQPRLVNHPELLKVSNGGLATVRLMTVRENRGRSEPLLAVLRMPVGRSIADNFDLGGIAAPVDLASGRCGQGIYKKGHYPPDTVHVHPDTGHAISDVVIPHWANSLALACRAHDLLEVQVPVIGWDVAVLAEGPVLVEANYLPDGNLAQMPAGVPLGGTAFAELVTVRLRQAFLGTPAP